MFDLTITHLATASSLSKKLPSTIEISSIIKCWQASQCWRTPGLSASWIHCSSGAFPEPIPGRGKASKLGEAPNSLGREREPSAPCCLADHYLQRRGASCRRCGKLPPRCWPWHRCCSEGGSPRSSSAGTTSRSLSRANPFHPLLPPGAALAAGAGPAPQGCGKRQQRLGAEAAPGDGPSRCSPAQPVKKTPCPLRTAPSTASCSADSLAGGRRSARGTCGTAAP